MAGRQLTCPPKTISSCRRSRGPLGGANKVYKMRTPLLILIPAVMIPLLANSQKISKPIPKIGWDSLQSRILYPDLAHRAGIEGTVWASLTFDSTGRVDSIITRFEHNLTGENSSKVSEMFSVPVRKALTGTSWLVPTDYSGWFFVPVQFLQTDTSSSHRLYIKAEKIKIKPHWLE
jgi:hypothetical protein